MQQVYCRWKNSLHLSKKLRWVVSVNTSTIHIAAAVETPVIVLYALSNPQHSPWMATGKVLPYDIPEALKSRNEVIRYVHEKWHLQNVPMVTPEDILQAIRDLLFGDGDNLIPEMIPLQRSAEQVL